MAQTTYKEAKDQYVDVNGFRLAYRQLGVPSDKVILFNVHFRGTMDHWDPLLIDTIGKKSTVILFDNAGVGRSGGKTPEDFNEWASYAIGLMKALHFSKYSVFGFSMGGMIAQLIALEAPKAVSHLILAGTAPSAGEGVAGSEPGPFGELAQAQGQEESRRAFLRHFFTATPAKQIRGQEWWKRMTSARTGRSDYLGQEGTQAQITAVQKWFNVTGDYSSQGSYLRLGEIKIPTLVANGSNDVLVATENSFLLWRLLINAPVHLHIYPDSGHGFLDEYSEHFGQMVSQFIHDDI